LVIHQTVLSSNIIHVLRKGIECSLSVLSLVHSIEERIGIGCEVAIQINVHLTQQIAASNNLPMNNIDSSNLLSQMNINLNGNFTPNSNPLLNGMNQG
jgi:hypothetical protein